MRNYEEERRAARERISEKRRAVENTHLVCDAEDLLPEAWKKPPVFVERGKGKKNARLSD